MELIPRKSKKLLWFLVFLLIVASAAVFLFSRDFTVEAKPAYGVTFSNKYAIELELDWKEMYLAMLDDLKVDNVRLVAYWDQIEPELDQFDYSDLDWQIEEAQKRGINVVMSVGRRMPRWPECHDPSWLGDLSQLAKEQQVMEFVQETVDRYKGYDVIKYWQVENEPLFAWFGHCPKPSKKFLAQEVDLVRSIDPRPIIVTDSGELNHWQGAGGLADVLGITLYRIVWNKYLGFWDYFFVPPAAYKYKADLTKYLQPNLDKVIVTELQMEPWTLDRKMVELTLEEQEESFDINRFRDNLVYAREAGFDEIYFWGVEYWYYLKEIGHPEIWEEAKMLWN